MTILLKIIFIIINIKEVENPFINYYISYGMKFILLLPFSSFANLNYNLLLLFHLQENIALKFC
ncbi:hypothetical protein Hanom_Chr07g00602801 [Helianthus anomalus]